MPLPQYLYTDGSAYRFEHRFERCGFAEWEWCRENLGVEALDIVNERHSVRSRYQIDETGRWFLYHGEVYIADQTDATAFKLVFG